MNIPWERRNFISSCWISAWLNAHWKELNSLLAAKWAANKQYAEISLTWGLVNTKDVTQPGVEMMQQFYAKKEKEIKQNAEESFLVNHFLIHKFPVLCTKRLETKYLCKNKSLESYFFQEFSISFLPKVHLHHTCCVHMEICICFLDCFFQLGGCLESYL